MKYTIGDKVKIKSYEELKKIATTIDSTMDPGDLLLPSQVHFNPDMIKLCEKEFYISSIHESWLVHSHP